MDDTHHEPHLRFRALWQRYERLVHWRCLLAARGRVDRARDMVQEVALRLIENCDTLHSDDQLPSERAWVLRIIRSTLADTLAPAPLQLHDTLPDRWADDTYDSDLNELLDDLAADLDDDERQFLQYYRDGFDLDDLATLYGLSYNAVTTRLARLRQKLALRARQLHYIR